MTHSEVSGEYSTSVSLCPPKIQRRLSWNCIEATSTSSNWRTVSDVLYWMCTFDTEWFHQKHRYATIILERANIAAAGLLRLNSGHEGYLTPSSHTLCTRKCY